MSGIPPELNNRLQRALLECGPFANDSDIKAVFVDKRIIPWRNRLPQANNPTSRVQAVVEFLHDQFSDDRENALVLLLRVLSGRVDPGDACYGRLTQLADELERELEGSDAIEVAIRMQDAQSNQLTSVHRAEAIAHIPESKGNGEQLYADVAWGGAHNSTREVLSEIPSGVHQPDGYSHYEIGLHVLLNRIELDDPHYPDALVYQQRLVENIKQSRRYGDNDTRKSERAEIVDRLNELSLSVLEVSFNKLCGTTSPFPRQEPIEADTRAISTTPSRPQVLLRPTVLLAAGIIIVAAIGVWILGTKTNLGVFDGADLSPTPPAIAASTQAPTQVPEVLASTDTQAPTPTSAPTNTPEPPISASKATATSTSAPVPLPVTLTLTPSFTPTDTPTSTNTLTLTSSPTIVPVSVSPTGVVTTAPPAMTPTPMATSLPALSEPKMVTQENLGDGVKFSWYWDDDTQLNNERWGYEFRFYAGAKVIATHIISPGQATVNDGQWSYILKDSDHPTWGWVPDCPGRWVVTAALLNEDGTYQEAILPEDTILNISAGFCPPGCNCGDGDGSGKGTPPP